MALPELYHLDRVRKLGGDGLVTYVGGSTTCFRVERVFREGRNTPAPSYYTPDQFYPTALLVDQHIIGGDHQDWEVYRLFHTLPSPKVWQDQGWNETLRTKIFRAEWYERGTISPPASGGRIAVSCGGVQIPNAVVLDSGLASSNGVMSKLFCEACAFPRSRVEWSPKSMRFPALFRLLGGWLVDNRWAVNPPRLGQQYDYDSPRTKRVTAKLEISFSVGPTNSFPAIYQVATKAELSQLFPRISSETIHQAFSLSQTFLATGETQLLERFAASIPATYSKGQTLIIEAGEQPVLGPLWMKTVVKVKEEGLP